MPLSTPTNLGTALHAQSPARQVILDSWIRSEAAGITRSPRAPELRRVGDEALAERLRRSRRLIAAATPHLQWLASTFSAIRHVASITDSDGIVLHSVGDGEFQTRFGLTPGYDWSEATMGTNGAGTALAAGKPVAVVGAEHYVEAFQNCTCTAAPIRDASGAIVGAIDFSTVVSDGSPERLALVAHVAYMIERELRFDEQLRETETYRGLSAMLQAQQEELELTNQRLQLLLDHVPTIVYLVDRNHRFLNVNRQWEAQLGIGCEEIIGRSLYELFPKETADQFAANNLRVLESGPTQFEEVYDDGSVKRTYLSLKVPVRKSSGEAYAVCGISTDITERKQMEEALRASEQALTVADRRKDEFLAMVSHELRNPLAPIAYGVKIVETLGGDRPQVRQACELMNRQVAYLTRLLDDLLDVSRVVHGRIDLAKQPTDFAAAVNAAVESVRTHVDLREQRLSVACPPGAVFVNADSLRLVQIVLNLLQNASKFTPPRGEIEVALTVHGGEALLRVKDSGAGIPPELLGRVFERFVQAGAPGSGGGLGLGLFLVKSFAELHGGSVHARSDGPGKGSEFVVRLPLI